MCKLFIINSLPNNKCNKYLFSTVSFLLMHLIQWRIFIILIEYYAVNFADRPSSELNSYIYIHPATHKYLWVLCAFISAPVCKYDGLCRPVNAHAQTHDLKEGEFLHLIYKYLEKKFDLFTLVNCRKKKFSVYFPKFFQINLLTNSFFQPILFCPEFRFS